VIAINGWQECQQKTKEKKQEGIVSDCAAHGKTTADRRLARSHCKKIFVTHAIMMRMKHEDVVRSIAAPTRFSLLNLETRAKIKILADPLFPFHLGAYRDSQPPFGTESGASSMRTARANASVEKR